MIENQCDVVIKAEFKMSIQSIKGKKDSLVTAWLFVFNNFI